MPLADCQQRYARPRMDVSRTSFGCPETPQDFGAEHNHPFSRSVHARREHDHSGDDGREVVLKQRLQAFGEPVEHQRHRRHPPRLFCLGSRGGQARLHVFVLPLQQRVRRHTQTHHHHHNGVNQQ